MTLSGYLITTAETALRLAEEADGVRYGGASGDFGFAAFDVPDWGDTLTLSEYGEVIVLQPHPDDPDSWPDWARGPRPSVPKRGIARGDERFILLRPTKHSGMELWQAVAPQCRASVALTYDFAPHVLVELGASDPFIADAAVVFDRVITEFRDARLVAV